MRKVKAKICLPPATNLHQKKICRAIFPSNQRMRCYLSLELGSDVGGEDEGGEARFVPDSEGFVEVVWVVSDGRARARQVKTGIQSETHIEVLDGLADDEEIVIGNYRAISRDLEDGSVVTVAAEKKG